MKLIVVLLVAVCLQSSAQTGAFDNCTDIRTLLVTSGDSLVIGCDTAYVLNVPTFRLYDHAYRDLRDRSPSLAGLMSAYDEIITLQDHRLREQQRSYDELRASFESLSTSSSSAFEQATRRLSDAAGDMDLLHTHLTEANRLLEETRSIMESERRGWNLEKVLWGAGGVAVGLVTGILLAR